MSISDYIGTLTVQWKAEYVNNYQIRARLAWRGMSTIYRVSQKSVGIRLVLYVRRVLHLRATYAHWLLAHPVYIRIKGVLKVYHWAKHLNPSKWKLRQLLRQYSQLTLTNNMILKITRITILNVKYRSSMSICKIKGSESFQKSYPFIKQIVCMSSRFLNNK